MKSKLLNKIVLSILLVLGAQISFGQTFGNEWINYSQSYLKFSVHEDGVYRISGAQLSAAGLTNATGANVQVYRDGQQVPIFVNSNNAMTGSNYLEFYGTKADGTVDAPLFKNASDQMNPSQNLISDTAYYFVTSSATGPYARYSLQTNTISGSPLKETYCWDVKNLNYRAQLSQGPSYAGSGPGFASVDYLESSMFEKGEGNVNTFFETSQNITVGLDKPYTVSGGPSAILQSTAVGFSYLTTHRLEIKSGNTVLADSSFGSFDAQKFNVAVPMSLVNSSGNLPLVYSTLNSGNYPDRVGIANVNVRYPRTFDFTGLNATYFELNPKFSNYYLEIDNFNGGSAAPVLYDMSSNKYLIGDISTAGKVRFLVPASSTTKKLYLISRAANVSKSVSNLKPIAFKNYSQASNQGDYLIITDPYYFNGGGGNNYVNDYRNFRASAVGGGYTAIIADVNDLYNEFGYGYNFHAQALKNFMHYATTSSAWSNKAKFSFLIGKGIIYDGYLTYTQGRLTNPSNYAYVPIPTFGVPASDMLLSDFDMDNIPELPIGRLSILNGSEIKEYLDKAVLHETNMANTNMQYADSILWRKRFLHIAGGDNATLQASILGYMNTQATQVQDTLLGGLTTTVTKASTEPIQVGSKRIDDAINDGVGFVQFFGHGSSQTLDFNLDFPQNYTNGGRLPVFMANGCGVGNVFSTNASRTLSERWIGVPNSGCINFIANSSTGLVGALGNYTNALYGQIVNTTYGKTIGEQFLNNIQNLSPQIFANNVNRFHSEQILLQGDPAISMYGAPKPDYAVEEKSVSFKQLSITTQMDSFDVKIIVYNLGKYIKDTVNLNVKRTFPDNTVQTILNKKYAGFGFTDTLEFKVAVGGDIALGQNVIDVTIDDLLNIDEMTEMNNNIQRTFTIFNDDLVPVYPYNFSIVSQQGEYLKASTLNPFLASRQYVFQIDTTEKFNSPSLETKRVNSAGGVIKWQPTTTYQDSVVYYWRTAMDTIYGNSAHRWSTFSFVYLDQSLPGWSQSHYYQYDKDAADGLVFTETDRDFEFSKEARTLQVQNLCLFGPSPYTYQNFDYITKVDGATISQAGAMPASYASLQFIVIDSITGDPWQNPVSPKYNSYPPAFGLPGNHFEFAFTNIAWRQRIMNFLDSIPDGAYVMMQPRICLGGACGSKNQVFIDDWKADQTTLGLGNSLYHKLVAEGFTQIDSFTKNRPMVFFKQKGNPSSVKQFIGADSTVNLYVEMDFNVLGTSGKLTSTKIGPAIQWGNFFRASSTDDPTVGDSTAVEIYGIDATQNEVLITTVYGDTSLSFIDANQYNCLRLVYQQKDSVFNTPEQLKYWRVHYQPVPEAALNPNRHFVFVDSMGEGQSKDVQIAIENLTPYPMDSMLVDYSLIDVNNNTTNLETIRYKPLPALDTIIATIPFSSQSFAGEYLFKVEANPNDDQLEQFHPNNIGFKPLYIEGDNKNPIIDVTFDGVRILNRDVVSAKPNILITLKDENKFLALNDTSVMSVALRYPDNPNVNIPIPYDDNILKFIPASISTLGTKNEAKIEFSPSLLSDGLYELVLDGKDKAGNTSGNVSYKVTFNVINKPAVSAVLNYPNPFSTSTQFVFTITGSEVPTNFKIQILNMAGRVVKEISKNELGDLHIGRNITTYRYKGDDQFGDQLGNGVYLYRVVSTLNGNTMDKHENDLADKWIEKGYGKMYIMR